MRQDVIAIDGPAGSGKSTVARLVAQKLGYLYIDTGAMYRVLTLKALEEKVDFRDKKTLRELTRKTDIQFERNNHGALKVILDSRDVTDRIREPDVNTNISKLSKVKEVRKDMVSRQRLWGASGRVVLEGRDIGTVVFPHAQYKFYLDAKFSERVKRRYKEFVFQNRKISWTQVRRDLLSRDRSDKMRKVAPLKKAADAIYIDTTKLTIDEVVEKILSYIRNNK